MSLVKDQTVGNCGLEVKWIDYENLTFLRIYVMKGEKGLCPIFIPLMSMKRPRENWRFWNSQMDKNVKQYCMYNFCMVYSMYNII